MTSDDKSDMQSPKQCRRCHLDEYKDWISSEHSLAFEHESFQTVWVRENRPFECLKCHNTGYKVISGQVVFEGVGCTGCHELIGDTRRQDESIEYHEKMSTFRTAAECATCHDTGHTPTYMEWETSAHNRARPVECLECHSAHDGDLTASDVTELCGECHLQPVPRSSPHMFTDSGCVDCHPSPIETNNVHMHGEIEAVAECTDCHMVVEADSEALYLTNSGHSMAVTLTACLNCHGNLHDTPMAETLPTMAETDSTS